MRLWSGWRLWLGLIPPQQIRLRYADDEIGRQNGMRDILFRASRQKTDNVHIRYPCVVKGIVVSLTHAEAVIEQTLCDHGGRHAASRSTREHIDLDAFIRQIVRISPLVMLSERIQHFKDHARLIAPQRHSAADSYRQFLGHRTPPLPLQWSGHRAS